MPPKKKSNKSPKKDENKRAQADKIKVSYLSNWFTYEICCQSQILRKSLKGSFIDCIIRGYMTIEMIYQ